MVKKVLFLFCCMFAHVIYAQNMMIKGTVIDANNDPLLGVTIMVKGTTTGTITDVDGNFSIKGKTGETLIVSYIGMQTQEVVFRGQPLKIMLKDDAQALEEVVVVGYGTMRKKDLTGSVIQVRPDKIANENPKTVQDILRGTPGLAIGYNADAKGGGSMNIRGQRSVYTDGNHNSPLLILDGMMFYGELSEINPDDIGQIDVLKDASAAAVYGAKAANGVIIITTKKGKRGKPVVNVSTNIGLTQRSAYRERFSPSAYLQHYADWKAKSTYGANAEGNWDDYQIGVYKGMDDYYTNPDKLTNIDLDIWRGYTSNESGESDLSIWAKRLGFTGNVLENILSGKTVDWEDKAFRLGFNQDYNASVSGASEKVDYYFSLGYLRNEGALIDDTYRAVRANMKLNAKVTNWFEIGANVNFQDRTDGSIDMDEGQFMRNSPYADYADEDNPGKNEDFEVLAKSMKIGSVVIDKEYNIYKDGLTYDRRPIVWIIDNACHSITGANYSFPSNPNWDYEHKELSARPMMEVVWCNSHAHETVEMPLFLDEVKSVYVAEDQTTWRDFIRFRNENMQMPVTVFVYTHHSFFGHVNGLRRTYFQGYNVPSTFEMNDYSVLPPMEDFRRTLYWNPDVRTDENGEAIIEFYNNSSCREIHISAEGITPDGRCIFNK